jgi:hypothetical protein
MVNVIKQSDARTQKRSKSIAGCRLLLADWLGWYDGMDWLGGWKKEKVTAYTRIYR